MAAVPATRKQQHRHQETEGAPEPGSVGQYGGETTAMDLGLDGYSPLNDPQGRHNQQQLSPATSDFKRHPRHDGPGGAAGGQFGILVPNALPQQDQHQHQHQHQHYDHHHDHHGRAASASAAGVEAPQQQAEESGGISHNAMASKIVVDPPDLEAWREKLFHVNETILLTDEQFHTYFPHVDNVYSHRSTQRYKRKPFVSHYWDCRMKGRPPGTPKSDDPAKKKRKRSTRERDLCDVKIKITEYLPGSSPSPGGLQQQQPEGSASGTGEDPSSSLAAEALASGQRLWTVQRVNGNGGNGKGDGAEGPHKHTLARSDEIKKSSVQRLIAKQEKQAKKTQKFCQRKASGLALSTTKKHTKSGGGGVKLSALCFCPFSQRVWIALEAKGLAYQYSEIDITKDSHHGPVPAIQQGDWSCSGSGVILEYLEDLDSSVPLLPIDAKLKAKCRLWIQHINNRILPAFYTVLRAHEPSCRGGSAERLESTISELVMAADKDGPLFLGPSLSLVDVHFAPFALRLKRILRPLRDWTASPAPGIRWQQWLEALETDKHVRATTSLDDLYLDTAELIAKRAPPMPGLADPVLA